MQYNSDSPNKITIPEFSLPKGGGAIKGIGETFQPNSFSGTGGFSIPLYTSPCRGAEPKLSLDYHSGSGNGAFGIGFSLTIPKVSRKTEKVIPRYQDTDVFILSNAEDLVPEPVSRQVTEDGVLWTVTAYHPRSEGLFAKIEYWRNAVESYWKVVSKENTTSVYGLSTNARISDPADTTRVFEWLLEKTYDAVGNKVQYSYQRENAQNVPLTIYEQNRSLTANVYLHSIRYGNYFAADAQEAWAFEVIFDYGEYNVNDDCLARVNCNPYQPTGKWLARLDPFSSYRSGFEIRTHRLCRNILLFHHLENELGRNPCLVRATGLTYQETPAMSQLVRVITQGYRRNDDGSYEWQAMPPLDLAFTPFCPTGSSFEVLEVTTGLDSRGYLPQGEQQFVDLYGQGLPGLLLSNGQTTLYWKPNGNGVYNYPEPPAQFPIERNLQGAEYALTSLESNGRLDLVVGTPQRGGFYRSNPDGSWDPYRSFDSYPADFTNPGKVMLDTSGNGLTDLTILEEQAIKIYPSLKKEGYGEPFRVNLTGEGGSRFPTASEGIAEEVMGFTDFFGDGLSHRFRIKNGSVECWPNLGYGHFGERVLLGNAPRFDEGLDPARLFLADLDGSGTTDLVYLYPDRADIYMNQGGNSFSASISIPLPAVYAPSDQIRFADIKGNGSTCLVFTKQAETVKSYFYDFSGCVKPYLLTRIDNNLGAVTEIAYRSSVAYYLDDLKSGRPWKTKLPFPVQVVARTETCDRISGSQLVTRYRYHDGYYDCTEREFRGFGFVEEWDTEVYEPSAQPGIFKEKNFPQTDAAEHVPPVYIKRWYHTGAFLEAGILSGQYRDEYYRVDRQAYLMPDSTLDPVVQAGDAETLRQAYRALKGVLIREEIYARDDQPGLMDNPYTVSENNFHVREVQHRTGSQPGVFLAYPRESINYYYERNPDDPRVRHQFYLQVDEFGEVTQSCQVFYPRRQPVSKGEAIALFREIYPEQLQLKATADVNAYSKPTADFWRWGILYEHQAFEIGGLSLSDGYFDLAKITAQVARALQNQIPNDGLFTPGAKQARLLAWERSYFWNDTQDARLPLGQITGQALLYNTETAVCTTRAITDIFHEQVTPDMLENEAGYHQEDNYWWNRGLVTVYYKDADQRFRLPFQYVNLFTGPASSLYQNTVWEYDPYALAVIKSSRILTPAITNTTEALFDYYTLQPRQITDPNANITQALYDPLGKVRATSIFGTTGGEREGDGDLRDYQAVPAATFADVLAHPEKYLQQATTYFYYDLPAWVEQGQPARYAQLQREIHISDLDSGQESRIQVQLGYTDGFGRELETKLKVDPGQAILWDSNGNIIADDKGRIVQATLQDRWLVSGRTVYNNKAKPVKQYLAYFSSTPDYEKQAEVDPALPPPTVIRYDPLLRVIRTDTPKGFFTKTEFTPWLEQLFDENDTVKDAEYYINFMQNYPSNPTQAEQDEKDALDKAAEFYNTPAANIFDNLGHAFLHIQMEAADKQLAAYDELDIQGRLVCAVDPRLYAANQQDHTDYYNFKYRYDMQGRHLAVDSADAGQRLNVINMFGQPVHTWDGRGFHSIILYDTFQRPVEVRVEGNDGRGLALNQSVEKLVYGEDYGSRVEDSQGINLRGQIYRHEDQGGVVLFPLYNLQNQVLQTRRRLLTDYKNEVNWDKPESVALEPEVYDTYFKYDVLNRVITETTPDQSVKTIHYNQAGLSDSIKVKYPDGSEEQFIKEIDYNSKLQLVEMLYGNGVKTVYRYEESTARLLGINSCSSGTGPDQVSRESSFQDITNTYDPMGNISRTRDASYETLYHNQQVIEALSDYTYNSRYQLVKAAGRQHPGVLPNDARNGKLSPRGLPVKTYHLNDGQQLEKYQETYEYDDAGNLAAIHHQAASGSWSRRMTPAPDSNRLTQVDSAIPGAGSYQASYDSNGNLLGLENMGLAWNYRNNIARADLVLREDDMADSEYYVYDGQGHRLRKVSERKVSDDLVETVEKIYLGNYQVKKITRRTAAKATVILERQSLHVDEGHRTAAVTHYWLQDDNHLETDQAGTRQTRYQFTNYLGSCSLELDSQGSLISYEEYFPYGGTALLAGENEREVRLKEYRFSGKERDITGLYDYGARYYLPWLGRWLNPDPGGTVDGLNLYAFVGGNPVIHTDPNGKGKEEITAAEFDEEVKKLRGSETARALIRKGLDENYEFKAGKATTIVDSVYELYESDLPNGAKELTHDERNKFRQDIIDTIKNFPNLKIWGQLIGSDNRLTEQNIDNYKDEFNTEFAFHMSRVDETETSKSEHSKSRLTLSFDSSASGSVFRELAKYMSSELQSVKYVKSLKVMGPYEQGTRTDSAVIYLNTTDETQVDAVVKDLGYRLNENVLYEHTPYGMERKAKGISYSHQSVFASSHGTALAIAIVAQWKPDLVKEAYFPQLATKRKRGD